MSGRGPLVRGVALVVGAASGSACVQPSTRAEAPLAIARWLDEVAVPTEHGLRWPVVPDASEPSFSTALYDGSCGPVLFFLELARAQRSPRWLATARAGADELLATLPAKCEGEGCGLYTGLAGIGFTLEQTWLATGEPRFRDGARRCVDELHAAARLAGSGVEWSDTTDVIAGSAGIGFFLLWMHAQEHDELALDLATRAGRRLLDRGRREAVGRSWPMDSTFPRVMPNFAHGTAGVACFLARLSEAVDAGAAPRGNASGDASGEGSGGAPFLDAASDGADHLLAIADREGGGCRIYHDAPDGTDLHYLGWCHGPCGTERLFSALAARTGEVRYDEAARGGVRSVITSGLPEERLPGFWNNVGRCCGSAGVIELMVERAARGGEPDALGFAHRVADDLVARGTRDEHGLRFVQAEHRVKPDLLEAQTGLMQGASGIGLALLHLDESERGIARAIALPDEAIAAASPAAR